VKTVDIYRARGMEKLELRSRAALVRFALANGLLEEALSFPLPQHVGEFMGHFCGFNRLGRLFHIIRHANELG
jgi:hypothetical protein